jgi:hypothetical protein
MTFDTCNCSCHRNKNCKHIVACCTECSICGKRIKMTSNFEKHRAACEANRQDLLNNLKEQLEVK